MRNITTSKGNWKIHGIAVISSDSIYQKVKQAIEEGNITEAYLQKITGHLSPIEVDFTARSITFCNF